MTDATEDRLQRLVQECRSSLQASRQCLESAQHILDELLHYSGTAGVARSIEEMAALIKADRRELIAGISAAMRGEPLPPQSVTELVVDSAARVARIGRRAVDLTDSEFEVLEMLWTNNPGVVSRRQILDKLYGGRNEPGERTIDVYISHIRQKLKAASGGLEFIEGVRGRGWMLVTASNEAVRQAA